MSFTTQTNEAAPSPPMRLEVHMVPFNANDAEVEVKTNLQQIYGFALCPAGTPGTTELLSLNEAVNDYGRIAVSGGSVTAHRAATTTSGLVVSAVFWGV